MKNIIQKLSRKHISSENKLNKEIYKLPNFMTDCDCSHQTYMDAVDYGEMNTPYIRRTCLECGGEIEKPE